MALIMPVVRHVLLCDDVTRNPDNPDKVNLIGLTSSVRALGDFPILLPQLCVYVQFTNGRGVGMVDVHIRELDTDRSISGSQRHRVEFPAAPLSVNGMVFRLLDCVFARPGLYQVEFRVDEKVVALEPLLVR